MEKALPSSHHSLPPLTNKVNLAAGETSRLPFSLSSLALAFSLHTLILLPLKPSTSFCLTSAPANSLEAFAFPFAAVLALAEEKKNLWVSLKFHGATNTVISFSLLLPQNIVDNFNKSVARVPGPNPKYTTRGPHHLSITELRF